MTSEYETHLAAIHESDEHTPWSEELAQRIATEDGIGRLTEAHWKVINTLRQHYVQYGALPPMQLACGLNSLNPHCIEELFKGSYEAWHVAGLPDPGSEEADYL